MFLFIFLNLEFRLWYYEFHEMEESTRNIEYLITMSSKVELNDLIQFESKSNTESQMYVQVLSLNSKNNPSSQLAKLHLSSTAKNLLIEKIVVTHRKMIQHLLVHLIYVMYLVLDKQNISDGFTKELTRNFFRLSLK